MWSWKRQSLMLSIAVSLCAIVSSAYAGIKKFSAPDFSGTYLCHGNDKVEGDYQATVKLELISNESQGHNGAYKFTLDVVGFGAYPGHAASEGNMMAMHFANADSSTKDYGTGIAKFKKNRQGKWMFSKYYYEPEYKGGNFGFEYCVQQ